MTKLVLAVFCFLTFFSNNVSSVCVDKNALNVVNATVHQSTSQRGFNVFDTNFYLLDTYVTIDILNANVTDLCEGMIKNFPSLKGLSLINVNLSKIQPNAFQKVPVLQTLSLAINNLTEIVKGSFDNLGSLEVLYLSGNRISYIESGVFHNMKNLRDIYLDRNEIVEVSGNLFSACPKIKTVNFGFNLIKKIVKTSFQDLRPDNEDPVIIYLNSNQINEVDASAFEMNNPVHLHLENNLISTLTDLLHVVKEDSKVYLNKNQFSCIPDEVIEETTTNKEVYLLDNPLDCECVDRIDQILEGEMYSTGNIVYNSTFPCQFLAATSF
ncbi:uncharacterized protein [Leptinotarsa decemlineata]|uniref:uncharacterized protein n=1 Tax=Leptinotarsa decemlineata TaxID=7539 RepID=UPI000C2527AA|nr:phospholipase A2 inhibitor-like [Leptinotarsa decemlineata]